VDENLAFYSPCSQLKAAIRTFKPKERKLVQPVERFKRAKFLANINRLRAIADQIVRREKEKEKKFNYEFKIHLQCKNILFI
jgi:hypothetical protein